MRERIDDDSKPISLFKLYLRTEKAKMSIYDYI